MKSTAAGTGSALADADWPRLGRDRLGWDDDGSVVAMGTPVVGRMAGGGTQRATGTGYGGEANSGST
jgi:hypothetical protein